MKRHVITVQKREVLGKKLKQLRREGILPGNVYGKDLQSLGVQLPIDEFQKIFKLTGSTGLVDLQVDGDKVRQVLIHNVAFDYRAQKPLHADFYQVNLKEKVTTMVPLEIVGEAPAVTEKLGQLLHTLSEVEVEALPTDLPENIQVDVTHLAALDDQITVADLKKPTGVEIKNDANQVIAKIAELVVEEPKEEAVAAEGEAPAEGAETEAKEGNTEEKSEKKSPDAK